MRGEGGRAEFRALIQAKLCPSKLRQERGPASLILGNNVLAHVPDINDFVGGAKARSHLCAGGLCDCSAIRTFT